jgi:exopolysaccharide production protein ExoQ
MHRGIKFQERPTPSRYVSDGRASFYVALSTIIMAYGGILGPISILLFYAMWLPRIHMRGVPTIKFSRYTAMPLLFASWCCLTAFWSNYPSKSLYSALEFASSIVCALIIAERVRILPFIRGIIYGSTVTLLASLASGRYGVDPFTGNASLVGLFGSKNMIGLFSDLLILSTVIIQPHTRGLLPKLFTCLLPGCIGVLCLYQSKSATSVLAIAATLALLAIIYGVTRMPRNSRWATFIMAATWLTVILSVGHMLDWEKAILRAFGKSTTLTGRTDLWDKGMMYGMHSPVIGNGFAAFWVKGNLPAEHLWYKFGIGGRSGFHFHNLFINTFVECGAIGVTLVFLILATTVLKSIKLILRHKMLVEYVFCLACTILFCIRSFAEVDIVGTYGIGAMLFYSLPPRLALNAAGITNAAKIENFQPAYQRA